MFLEFDMCLSFHIKQKLFFTFLYFCPEQYLKPLIIYFPLFLIQLGTHLLIILAKCLAYIIQRRIATRRVNIKLKKSFSIIIKAFVPKIFKMKYTTTTTLHLSPLDWLRRVMVVSCFFYFRFLMLFLVVSLNKCSLLYLTFASGAD